MGCCASTSADAGPGPSRLLRLSVGSQSIEEENGDRRVSTAVENGGKPGEDPTSREEEQNRASFRSWTDRSAQQPDRSLHQYWVMTLDTFLGEVGRRPSLFQTIVDLRRRTARWSRRFSPRSSMQSRSSIPGDRSSVQSRDRRAYLAPQVSRRSHAESQSAMVGSDIGRRIESLNVSQATNSGSFRVSRASRVSFDPGLDEAKGDGLGLQG
ncbi:unnamed protein product [Cladocopium goreaui]|uniref:Uncharacterized protein n=1 Tax=Cladocopium goreaui TaxID=2562237 RepID=A0A9P1FX20_9DINO|nr:unnamed protein product [Cladocopium goreaui]